MSTDRAQPAVAVARARSGSGATRVPYPIHIREVEVTAVRPVSAAMVRITLGGPGTAGFESHVPTEHVKLIFPDADGRLRLPEPDGLRLRWPRPLPVSREYTVRHRDEATGRIDIDVVLHADGVATGWARSVRPGARVHVAGPPGGLVVPDGYDRYLLAGDATAIPAIARWLEALPRSAAGWALIEAADAGEELPIAAPAGIELRWLHRGTTAAARSRSPSLANSRPTCYLTVCSAITRSVAISALLRAAAIRRSTSTGPPHRSAGRTGAGPAGPQDQARDQVWTNGIVVVTATNPSRSRTGRLVGRASVRR